MIKNIIFDFDGVILDSVPVKTEAFIKLFQDYEKQYIDKLVEYHLKNGGKSRYLKIQYFFEDILGQSIKENTINEFAIKYSQLTKEELSNKKYLITDTIEFIKLNYTKYNLHIASGADKKDLKYICDNLDLTKYFLSINGSPTVKSEIVREILKNYDYKREETILIGDSINDYEAAKYNRIEFYGYKNENLVKLNKYIKSFKSIKI